MGKGQYADLEGKVVKVVGFRAKARGPLTDAGPWAVVVEQSGDYRLGTVRVSELTNIRTSKEA